MLTLRNYKKIRTPFVFFDETGSINDKANRFFCLGMIKCMQPYYLDCKIRRIKDKYRFYDEIKWNTISKAKISVLKEVLDAVFSTPGIYFSCIVINKDNLDFEKEFNNDPYMAYQKFTEILLKQNVDDNEVLTVLADFVTTPKNIEFEVSVKHDINKELDRLAIAGVHRVDSKGVNLIQVADLLIGAVVYSYKKELKLVRGDRYKFQILRSVLRRLGLKNFLGGLNTRRFKVLEY